MVGFLDAPPAPAAITITDDGGGSVRTYEEALWDYRLQDREVRILGGCRSACTLALSLRKVCVGPEAVVRWHFAYNREDGKLRLDVTERMLAALPERVAAAVRGRIAEDYTPGATLTGDQLVRLGVAPCPSTAPHDDEAEGEE